MTKRMLIDGTHAEETRVVVLDGNRLEEYDFETSTKKQLKGNIYLAKVTRVEPSLQAAFVDFGGNRHGFLAFNEIHPDYYQIPIADREALVRHQAAMEAEAEAEADEEVDSDTDAGSDSEDSGAAGDDAPRSAGGRSADADSYDSDRGDDGAPEGAAVAAGAISDSTAMSELDERDGDTTVEAVDTSTALETVGGDDGEGPTERRRTSQRHYKIQEVIKRRQILLVQVVKEERGNKGAALTTYLSLAGRYCVLMPNTARGGGVSRKITNAADRKRMKAILSDLDMPEGMGVILRTAGMERSKAEIRRDFDYLMRTWDTVREVTLQSSAPALVYEEGNLIKRAIRDLYSRDLDEVLVAGEETYKIAKTFMRLLMPSHAKRVKAYREDGIPLLHRFQVENQLDAMHSPIVQLKSGGYIVINPTEALVAIDVNSGKSTRERNIEETAHKTNLEAADEIARQLRLRDLAGLVVIDFIDMEDRRNVRNVERRLKEAMQIDRARIQLGRISPFGLLELSRQRLRPSLIENTTKVCPFCGGAGHVRSTESMAVHVLRAIEEEGIRQRATEIAVEVPTDVALYILNQKRGVLNDIEKRYAFSVTIAANDTLIPADYRIERIKARAPGEIVPFPTRALPSVEEDEEEDEATAEPVAAEDEEAAGEQGGEAGAGTKRRRSRRRRKKTADDGAITPEHADEAEPAGAAARTEEEPVSEGESGEGEGEGAEAGANGEDGAARKRRRGRRGGRRRSRRPSDESGSTEVVAEAHSAGTFDLPVGDEVEGAAVPEAFVPEPVPAWEDRYEPVEPAPTPEPEFAAVTETAPAADEKTAEMPAPAPEAEGEPRPVPDAEAEPVEVAKVPGGNGSDPAEAPTESSVTVQDIRPSESGVQAETVEPPSDQPRRRGWWQRLIE